MKHVHWQEDMALLGRLRLFQNVTASSLGQLLKEFRACDLDAGEIVLSPFNRNQYLYLVVSGRLKVYLGSLDNNPVSSIGPGECAGEISFIDNDHPSAYVVAAEPTTVLRLHRQSLVSLFQQSPQLMQNLLEVLCDRVRQGNRIILDTEQNAKIDTLTGLFNRRWLEQIYQRESTRCSFNEQPMSMLMLDVDHFKSYNDRHGHLAGDYALCLVSHTLRNQLRPKDSMARYGGEEFVILLPEMGGEEARTIGERLRSSLEQIPSFYSPLGVLPGVTISIGLAEMQRPDSLQGMISRADNALYQAKQDGRNRLNG
ncbi:GGDEF domain-containing protein [Pseudomonas sp. JS3066]|jgi:diguanylate cyclase (GGDEF)-like protein|uniref:GGDEF domain-containing protein n=1 Tax=unclassified Pseudomonas TaxID=196821 RepID=UPI000EA916D1|nr:MULTISPECIES: GGDEF domain-containing protein [unclassified Pseudomonas]AYF88173.1 GGDEF domain-containing protein [Pseudomonas sp. DY-1]MDH4654450.1 GGDEF domain-containing protein [Pseudomonas sp. BN606]MRK24252.1 GGDEF domain-containing protein [Pseudomonas sp. JG-B]WVK94281.1 GGDEF domain-containing protein [Pseudomonas sp. JS3066]